MRSFGVYKRKNGIFYGYLINPVTGERLPARSTGTKNKQEAEFVVINWRREGFYSSSDLQKTITVDTAISTVKTAEWNQSDINRLIEAMKSRGFIDSAKIKSNGPEATLLNDFLVNFWTFDESPYVKERLAFGFSCHRAHIKGSLSRAKNHWKEYFPESMTIGDIKRSDIEKFQLYLKDLKLANKTINHVINSGRLPLSWAFKKGMVPSDPTEGLQQFSQQTQKRGILSKKELAELFKPEYWKSEVSRVGALLSSTTGMRLGEIRALQVQDIKMDRITINHSYNNLDGLKAPKNNESRDTPLLPHVRIEIMNLINNNPNRITPETFIFYSSFKIGKTEPAGLNTFNENLKHALSIMKIDYRERHISFHSLRHGYTTYLAGKVGLEALQGIVGHKDQAMTAHYSNHQLTENFEAVQKAAEEAFKGVI